MWEPLVDKVFDTEQPAEQEDELPTLEGPRHFLTRVVPEFGPDGEVNTVLSTSHDITKLNHSSGSWTCWRGPMPSRRC